MRKDWKKQIKSCAKIFYNGDVQTSHYQWYSGPYNDRRLVSEPVWSQVKKVLDRCNLFHETYGSYDSYDLNKANIKMVRGDYIIAKVFRVGNSLYWKYLEKPIPVYEDD